MQRKLRIYYTSDTHGFFSPIDYATGGSVDSGLANCMSNFQHSGNTLVIDGGDTLQGSPFTYWLGSHPPAGGPRHTLTGSVGLRSKEEIKAMLDGCK